MNPKIEISLKDLDIELVMSKEKLTSPLLQPNCFFLNLFYTCY
jgi:hypothetical protein